MVSIEAEAAPAADHVGGADSILAALANTEVERFLPAAFLVGMYIIEPLVSNVSLNLVWSSSSTAIKITALLCPLGAVAALVAGVTWSRSRLVIAVLTVASFTAPVMSLREVRRSAELSSSLHLSDAGVNVAWADAFATVPFAAAAGLSLAIAMLSLRGVRPSQRVVWMLTLLALLCAMSSVILMRSFIYAAATGEPLDGFAKWIAWVAT
jgi:hypothetical protein